MACPQRILFPLGLALALGCSGGRGESGPDAALGGECPETVIEDGAPCTLAPTVRCMIGGDDCGLAEVCSCADGVFSCAPPDYGAACGDIEDASCAIEGVHGCYMNPTSGTRHCDQGVWVTTYSCPPGCPGPDDSPPNDGDDCDVAAADVCQYESQSCECVAGKFSCV